MLSLELIHEVVNETVVEILTTQVSITGSGFDFEDTLLDGQERDIESSSSEIEDENVSLTLNLLVETIGNGSGSGLVDDSENIQTGNETSIFCGLTLRIGEVGGDGNDGVVNSSTKVCLCGLSHLDQDHR